ncbi:hypothetical protein DITRI_Ditri19aG0038500 [Diplodiscus trichospermus]
MGFAAAAKAVLLLQLSVFLLSTFTVSAQILPEALPPRYHGVSPVMAPSHPPSHHHHHHPHSPTPSPTKPPTHPPVYPPPKAPTPAPLYPPPKPPVHPPTRPPVHPPTKPPTLPPTKPPVHPPTYPPLHPPAKPPTYPRPPRSLVTVQGVVFCKSCKYAGVDNLSGAKPILGATVKLTCKNTKYKQVVQAKTDKNGYFFVEAPKTVTSFGAHKCTVSLLSSPLASCSKPSNLHGGLKGATLRFEKPFTANKLPYILYTVGPFAFEPKCY